MKDKTNPSIPASEQLIENLAAIIGFNPTKGVQPNKEVFSEVIEEIGKERAEKAKEQAKALTAEAIKAAEEFGKVKKAFAAQEQKFVKEFTKTMKKIEALASGQEPPSEEEQNAENK